MQIEDIIRNMDYIYVNLGDDLRDALSTTEFGLVQHVKGLRIGNEPTFTENGIFSIHTSGDPTKIAVSEKSTGRTTVTTIALADLSSGLMRAGYDAEDGRGEITLIIMIDADMPTGTMARAAMTATEAVTAVMQDLDLRYSGMSASGSVIQNIVVLRRRECGLYLRGAGKHCRLGELIASSVSEAVRESAGNNCVSSESRRSIIGLLSGYGYDQNTLFRKSGMLDVRAFIGRVMEKDSDPRILAAVTAVLHICDEISWGLVDPESGTKAGKDIISCIFGRPAGEGKLLDVLTDEVLRYFIGS